jgi:hypothetical protein
LELWSKDTHLPPWPRPETLTYNRGYVKSCRRKWHTTRPAIKQAERTKEIKGIDKTWEVAGGGELLEKSPEAFNSSSWDGKKRQSIGLAPAATR